MTDTPSAEDLARMYMDLWQQNMAGLTRDPKVAESIARLFELMTAGASGFAQMMAAQGAAAGAGPRPGEAQGAPPPNPGHGKTKDIGQRLDQLARRVAELERRIARLEPRTAKRRAPSSGRPRRRPS